MDEPGLAALLAIAQLPHVGERRIGFLLQQARRREMPLASLVALPARQLADEFRLPVAAVTRLQTQRYWHQLRCAGLAAQLASAGVRLAVLGDAPYPAAWQRHAAPAPPLAWLHGEARLLTQPTVALLHSRLVSDRTVDATLRLVRVVAEDGLALALAGMKTAHRVAAAAARALAVPRLVVLDRGMLAAFGGRLSHDPFGLGPGRSLFDPDRTLALSPFRPDDHALPRSGRRRDGLLAALGDLVVVASVRPGGETERVALQALARGQRVLVWGGASASLGAAGALPFTSSDLAGGLRSWLPTPASARRR